MESSKKYNSLVSKVLLNSNNTNNNPNTNTNTNATNDKFGVTLCLLHCFCL